LYVVSVAVSLFNWIASLALIAVDNQRGHAVTLFLPLGLSLFLFVCLPTAQYCPVVVHFVYATIKIRNERDCKLKRLKNV